MGEGNETRRESVSQAESLAETPDQYEGFKTRDGDVLVVNWPEIKVPVIQFSTVSVGGLSYTRRLTDGEDPEVVYHQIYAFLERVGQRDAREKLAAWGAEFKKAGLR